VGNVPLCWRRQPVARRAVVGPPSGPWSGEFGAQCLMGEDRAARARLGESVGDTSTRKSSPYVSLSGTPTLLRPRRRPAQSLCPLSSLSEEYSQSEADGNPTSGQFCVGMKSKTSMRVNANGRFGQYARRWKRWVLSGVWDVPVSYAFNWPAEGLDPYASASQTLPRLRAA